MSHGRSGKLQQRAAAVGGGGLPKPHVPPLPLHQSQTQQQQQQLKGGPLWRETDAALEAQRPTTGAGGADSAAAGQNDPRAWTWDVILASSQQHGTTQRPYRPSFERPNERDGLDLGRAFSPAPNEQRVRRLPSQSQVPVPARMLPPSMHTGAIGLLVDGEMMGAAAAAAAINAPATSADSFVHHTQTRTQSTTTTTITQTQTNLSESITTTMPIKPRALGDGGVMLSYGREDGPSAFTTAMLPALRTSERDELKQLGEALEHFVRALDTQRLAHLRLDERGAVDSLLDLLKEEQGVYDLFFDEVIRQVATQCKERGDLLGKIRAYYASLLLRVPLHLYSLQSELAAQRQLNHTLQEESRVMREQSFAIQVELGAYAHRFKEAAHELEMHKDMLSRAEHEKDRARAMFTQFREEWDHQRRELEEQLTVLKEEREDYLSTSAATATALAKSRNPNLLVHSLLDESDSDEERVNARLALIKDLQDDDTDLIDATTQQIDRDQANARMAEVPALPAPAAVVVVAAVAVPAIVVPVEPDTPKASPSATSTPTLGAVMAPPRHRDIRRGVGSENSPRTAARNSISLALSALPDLQADVDEALVPERFKKRPSVVGTNLGSVAQSLAQSQVAQQRAADRREARTLRKALDTARMREAREAEAEALQAWAALDAPARAEVLAKLYQQLPGLSRDHLDAVANDETRNGIVPILVDFLARIESCSFNQSEMLLVRLRLPAGAWCDATRDELSRRGLLSVAEDLFSPENERAVALAHLIWPDHAEAEEPDQEELLAREKERARERAAEARAEAKALAAQQAAAADADLAALSDLASPNASVSVRQASMRASLSSEKEDPSKAARLAAKIAREDRRRQKAQDSEAEVDEEGNPVQSQAKSKRRSSRGSISGAPSAAKPSRRKDSTASRSSSRRNSVSTRERSKTPDKRGSASKRTAPGETGSATASNKNSPAMRPLRASFGSEAPRTRTPPTEDVLAADAASIRREAMEVAARSTRAPLSRDGERHAASRVHRPIADNQGDRSRTASVMQMLPVGGDHDELTVELVGTASGGSISDDPAATRGEHEEFSSEDEEVRNAAAGRSAVQLTKQESLSSRRATLPSTAGPVLTKPKPPEAARPRSISIGLIPGANAARLGLPAPVPGKKVHHRHHSRADPSTSITHSSSGSLRIPTQPQQDTHPILTLSDEHAQAANDPRANDDHELVYRLQHTSQSTETPTTSASSVVVSPRGAAVNAATVAKPRRPGADAQVPRSFFEASQLLPVSKIVVAPAARGHVETPRERELQLVVADLIAQNELLHAQRQALAQLHGVRDTGAQALPSALGNFDSGSREAQELVAATSTSGPHQQGTADKQNALLAKVNEYLNAYRTARKAAGALFGPAGAPQDGSGSEAAMGTPDNDIALDPASQANSLARNVLAGPGQNLLFNSRFLSLLKSATPAPRKKDADADEPEGKEQSVDGNSTARTSRTARGGPAPIPNSARTGTSGQLMSKVVLVKWLRSVYDAKLARDDLCRKEGAALQRFPEFLLEVQRKQYGLPSICAQKTLALVTALSKHRDSDREVQVFAEFLEEARSLDELILFLRTRAVVLASTVGVRWPGHLLEKGQAAAGGVGGKCTGEYISLCRARDAISTIFAHAGDLQDAVYRELLAACITWNQLPDPITAARWATLLPGHAQVDERCVHLPDFLERMLHQFRDIELQLRHHQWAEDLFNSAVHQNEPPSPPSGGLLIPGQAGLIGHSGELVPTSAGEDARMDFAAFQQVFSLAEPRYSAREIAQLYANVTRNAGLKTLSRSLFKRLVHTLMREGNVMFPLLKHAGYEAAARVRMVVRHWHGFREFVDYLGKRLAHSEHAHDVAAANHLRQMRGALEREIARAAGGGGHDASDAANSMSSVTRRLVCLYRGLLNYIAHHQAAFTMATLETPVIVLHTELKAMQHVILQRHRLHDTSEARVDAWLEGLASLTQDEQVQAENQGAHAALGEPLSASSMMSSRDVSGHYASQAASAAYGRTSVQSSWTTPDHEVARHFAQHINKLP